MFRKLLVFILLVGYFAWPYFTAKKFSQAIIDRDSEAIKRMLDMDSIRESMVELMLQAAVQKANATAGANPVDPDVLKIQMRSVLNSPAVKEQFEKSMSADAFARMVATGSKKDSVYRNPSWRNPFTFTVQDPNSEARSVFKFRGIGWKLAGIEVPDAEIGRFLPPGMM